MIGKMLGHYKIVSHLGRGGMGEVYLAEDTKLGRQVALKILPPKLAADPERRARFEREARSIAALNHPNIVTLYTVEESKGDLFLTMEHVTGSTLDKIIPADGLHLSRFFEIAIPLADALAAAHANGIVHRDLKPANVMLTAEERVKVLDFGVAKLVHDSFGPDDSSMDETELVQTSDGVILGTAAYMSPEQAEGKRVDARSDIFSLGVVFYEMITGQRPFRGDSTVATITAILRDTPRNLRELKSDMPHHLARIVEHCLAKQPDRRTQTALDVRNELHSLKNEIQSADSSTFESTRISPKRGRRIAALIIGTTMLLGLAAIVILRPWRSNSAATAEPSSANRKSIAVLPFTNMSADPDNEYFSDGLAETLLHRLAQITDLKVAARTSSFSFKGSDSDIVDIAEQLGVANVLEGSVQKSGNRLRITVQLINAGDGSHLLSRSFDRTDSDVFAVQDEIADEVVSALQVELLERERQKFEHRDTESLEAYNAYLLGLQRINKTDWRSLEEAVTFFERAIDHDPNYAQAWAGIAMAHLDRYGTGAVGPEILDEVQNALDRALALEPDHADANLFRGVLMLFRQDPQAEQVLLRAARLAPNSSLAPRYLGGLAMNQFEMQKAIDYWNQGLELDPLSVRDLSLTSVGYEWVGDWKTVNRLMERIREIDPDVPRIYYVRSYMAHLVDGRADDGVRLMQLAIEKDPADHELKASLCEMYVDLRAFEKARNLLNGLVSKNPESSVVAAAQVRYHFRLGQEPQAQEISDALVHNPNTIYRHGSRLILVRAASREDDLTGTLRIYETLYPKLLSQKPTQELEWMWPSTGAHEFAKACADYARLLLQAGRADEAEKILERASEIREKLTSRGRFGAGVLDVELAAIQGETETSLILLQEIYNEAPTGALWWDLNHNPNFEALRGSEIHERISASYEKRMDQQRGRLENEGT